MFKLPVSIDRFERQSDGKLLVEGTATTEAAVFDGELMADLVLDYDASKKAAASYTGAIREMHKNEAVGHALDVVPDDASRSIRIKAFVSDGAPLTQKKVIDGTLRGFSVGGKVKAAVAEGAKKRATEWEWIETSLVDVGADPGANDLTILLCRGAELQPALTGQKGNAMATPKTAADAASGAGESTEKAQGSGVNRFAEALAAVVPQPPQEARKPRATAGLARAFRAPLARHYEGGNPLDDLTAATWLLLDLTQFTKPRLAELIAAEAVEMAQGQDEGGQIAGLQSAMAGLEACEAALKAFIGAEAGELIAGTEAPAAEEAVDGEVEAVAKPAAGEKPEAKPGEKPADGEEADDEDVENADLMECAHCSGTGTMECAHCAGTGTMKCAHCAGVGKVAKGMEVAEVAKAARPTFGYAALSRKLDALAAKIAAPPPVPSEPVLTSTDGVQMVLAIGAKIQEHTSTVTRALDSVSEIRADVARTAETITKAIGDVKDDVKAVRGDVNVIASQPAIPHPVRFAAAPEIARTQGASLPGGQKLSSKLAGIAEGAPTTEARQWLRNMARSYEIQGD